MASQYSNFYKDGSNTNNNVYPHSGYPIGNMPQMTYDRTSTIDPTLVKRAVKKLRTFCLVAVCLSVLTIISGIATLAFAAENIGFPVFNFGPLLVGLVYFCGTLYGFIGCRKLDGREVTPEMLSSLKCPGITVFVVSVTCISLSAISAVFSILSGVVCAGGDVQFYSREGNIRRKLDVKQYCYPNDVANTAMGFINGGLCLMICFCCILGCVLFCCYGRLFGVKQRNNC
ncbi:hypothetical protein ACF0H5_013979 [Mactra antiquata]